MSCNEAVVLSYLINHAGVCKAESAENEGWFYCKIRRISEDLFFSEDQQDRALRSLKHHGFLDTIRKGLPCKRYFKIDYLALRKAIVSGLREWESMAKLEEKAD